MDVVVRRGERGFVRGNLKARTEALGQGRRAFYGRDLVTGVGGEVEFVVDEAWGGWSAHETEKAGVRAGAEGDDLFSFGWVLR